jgi:hypothetical protein
MADEPIITRSTEAEASPSTPAGEQADTEAPSNPQSDCDRDFDLYESERQELRKAELEAEKSYDTNLVTLSGLALGVSLTILKDFIGRDTAVWLWALITAWVCFLACLLLSLWDKKLTYETHKAWRGKLDESFANWRPGIWDAVLKEYDTIPGIKCLPALKRWATRTLVGGIVFLSLFVLLNVLIGGTNAAKSKAGGNAATTAAANAGTADQAPVSPATAGPSQVATVNVGVPPTQAALTSPATQQAGLPTTSPATQPISQSQATGPATSDRKEQP